MSLVSDLADLKASVARLTAGMRGLDQVPRMRWGTVTALSPLTVTLDGDTAACGVSWSAEAVTVGARVLVQVQGQDRWIMALAVGSAIPPGFEGFTAASTAPSGWLIRDGSAYSRVTYAGLFAAIGTTYGVGDGSTTFNVPDLRGRVDLGVGTATGAAGATAHTLGQKGGEETHALTVAEGPSHTHSGASAGSTGLLMNGTTGTGANVTTGGGGYVLAGLTNSGSGTAHNTLPPYLAGTPIIKF